MNINKLCLLLSLLWVGQRVSNGLQEPNKDAFFERQLLTHTEQNTTQTPLSCLKPATHSTRR